MSRLGVLPAACLLAGCTAILGFGERVESVDDAEAGAGAGAGPGELGENDAATGGGDGGDAVAAPGDTFPADPYVDPSFGTAGRVLVPSDPAAAGSSPYDCTAAVAGDALWLACAADDLDDASGVLDRIAADGTVSPSRALPNDAYFGLLPTPAGLLAVGFSGTVNVAVRLLDDGTADPGFGAPRATVGQVRSRARGLTPDGAGGFLVWGDKNGDADNRPNGYAVTLGTTTPGFGTALVTDPITTALRAFWAKTATRLDAATVLVAGEMGSPAAGTAHSLAIVRFADGTSPSVAATYSPAPGASIRVGAATADATHAIVAGVTDELTTSVLTRTLPSGTLDATFGQGGVRSLAAPAGAPAGSVILYPRAILPLVNGGLYVGGRVLLGSGVSRAFLARLRSDGTVDPTFAGGGYAYPRLFPQPTFEEICALALRADGALYAVGSAVAPSRTVEHFALRFR